MHCGVEGARVSYVTPSISHAFTAVITGSTLRQLLPAWPSPLWPAFQLSQPPLGVSGLGVPAPFFVSLPPPITKVRVVRTSTMIDQNTAHSNKKNSIILNNSDDMEVWGRGENTKGLSSGGNL